MLVKKFREVISNRGKKGTDKYEQIELLGELLTVSELNQAALGVGVQCKVYISLISATFDLNSNIFDSMKLKHWLLLASLLLNNYQLVY